MKALRIIAACALAVVLALVVSLDDSGDVRPVPVPTPSPSTSLIPALRLTATPKPASFWLGQCVGNRHRSDICLGA